VRKRPADVIGAAVMVAKIATGEIEEPRGKAPKSTRRTNSRRQWPQGSQTNCGRSRILSRWSRPANRSPASVGLQEAGCGLGLPSDHLAQPIRSIG
jgi:hypothetical protein